MFNLSKSQLLTIAAALLLIVLLLLAPGTGDMPVEDQEENVDSLTSTKEEAGMFKDKKASLPDDTRKLVENLEYRLENTDENIDKLNYLDSLAQIWTIAGESSVRGYYLKKKAEIAQEPEQWMLAGDSYFNAFRRKDSENKKLLIKNAIGAYQNALKLDSNYIKAKTSLGVCYVEGAGVVGKPPMKGIEILLEVIEEDPENIDALINLGYFSIRSGQYQKAKERFKRVLQIDPEFAEAYIYLADIDLIKKDTSSAINHLEEYKKLAEDSMLIQRTDQYIQSLKDN